MPHSHFFVSVLYQCNFFFLLIAKIKHSHASPLTYADVC
jgi:hypothetical protein